MAKVVWSPKAVTDVDLIAEYIGRDSPKRASLVVKRLVKAVDSTVRKRLIAILGLFG